MKILHLLSQRPEHTGSGVYIRAIIAEAEKKGHNNYLLAGVPGDKIPDIDILGNDRFDYVPFETEVLPFPVVGMSDVMPYKSRRFCDLSASDLDAYESAFTEKLISAVADFEPDLIHSHHLWLLSALTRRLFPDIPMVTTCHGTDLRQYTNCPHLRPKVKIPCSKINGILALSHHQKNEIAATFDISHDKIHVVGGGYNNNLFSIERKKSQPPVDIVFAGKLSFAKGLPWLLKSLSQIPDLPWHLHIAGSGSGSEMEECLKLAQTLENKVTYHGRLNHADLAKLLKSSHIFVLPSFFEGLPLVLLEALASGCRLITTSLPGTTEVLGQEKSDYISFIDLPPLESIDKPFESDEKALEKQLAGIICDQIKAVLDNPDINPAKIEQITGNFGWKAVYNRTESVYHRVTALRN